MEVLKLLIMINIVAAVSFYMYDSATNVIVRHLLNYDAYLAVWLILSLMSIPVYAVI